MKKEGSKFRPLTVVLPIEKIMKEAIRMVPESIYDPEFPDTPHFRSGRGSLISHQGMEIGLVFGRDSVN